MVTVEIFGSLDIIFEEKLAFITATFLGGKRVNELIHSFELLYLCRTKGIQFIRVKFVGT